MIFLSLVSSITLPGSVTFSGAARRRGSGAEDGKALEFPVAHRTQRRHGSPNFH